MPCFFSTNLFFQLLIYCFGITAFRTGSFSQKSVALAITFWNQIPFLSHTSALSGTTWIILMYSSVFATVLLKKKKKRKKTWSRSLWYLYLVLHKIQQPLFMVIFHTQSMWVSWGWDPIVCRFKLLRDVLHGVLRCGKQRKDLSKTLRQRTTHTHTHRYLNKTLSNAVCCD